MSILSNGHMLKYFLITMYFFFNPVGPGTLEEVRYFYFSFSIAKIGAFNNYYDSLSIVINRQIKSFTSINGIFPLLTLLNWNP